MILDISPEYIIKCEFSFAHSCILLFFSTKYFEYLLYPEDYVILWVVEYQTLTFTKKCVKCFITTFSFKPQPGELGIIISLT